jgi:hypothetical protein
MLGTQIGTATAGATAIDLPTRFLEAKKLEFTSPTNVNLIPRPLHSIEAARSYVGTTTVLSTSVPSEYTLLGTRAAFPSALDQQYIWRFVFYQQPAALSTATGTNFLTDMYPRILSGACKMLIYEGIGVRNMEERRYWRSVTVDAISAANAEADRGMHGIEFAWPTGYDHG